MSGPLGCLVGAVASLGVRWYRLGGGGYWGDTGSPATFSLSAVSHHCAPSIPAPSLTSWWKGGSHSRPPLSTAPSVCRVYEAVCAHVFTLVTFLGRYCMILWEKISFHKLS